MRMIELIKHRLFGGVRRRMVSLFLFTVLLTALSGVYVINPSMQFIKQMDEMFFDTVFLDELTENLNAVDQSLREYLTTRDSDSLLTYYEHAENLGNRSSAMKDAVKLSQTPSELIYKDIAHMIDTYIYHTDEAVRNKRGRTPDLYISDYNRAYEVAGYIKLYIDKLDQYHLEDNTRWYTTLSSNMSKLVSFNIILLAAVVLLNVFMILYITYNITAPIQDLSKAAGEIAKGNFDTEEIVVATEDEFRVMADAFNKMKHSIKEYVAQLQDKADTEARLMDQRMQNLRMQTLLNGAELKALQSQINPHFLFNTLNAVMQLATMEGADRTAVFIDNLARLLRYNVGTMDRTVSLREEIAMISAYQELFNVRFGDMRSLEFDVDESVLDAIVPPLIIQPLVENAYIHGLGEVEGKGLIRVRVKPVGGMIEISVEDNGVGMDEKTRQRLLKHDDSGEQHDRQKGHLTGIGIDNVVNRLRMLYGVEDILDIRSEPGRGTAVILTIPYREEDIA
jgi:two-component system sensor histidine kinase YesM